MNEENKCPKCGSEELAFDSAETDGVILKYPVACMEEGCDFINRDITLCVHRQMLSAPAVASGSVFVLSGVFCGSAGVIEMVENVVIIHAVIYDAIIAAIRLIAIDKIS